ncbi:NAD(P)-dependent oxidoreductase [Runella sp.]|uniref:NAD(P)-dependent oxidoreductase n=1 Tax=Runella sp. TaxID=1960881 RepID=UPI003D0A3452
MKKIIVFGATGGTGKSVVEQALEAGYEVTVVVRNPEAFTLKHPQLKILKGDVFKTITFEIAIAGQDAVVSCLGIQKRETTTVYSEGVGNIIKVMQREKVKRIICLSAGAVVVPSKASFIMKFMTKNFLQRLFGHLYSDMLEMEKILSKTDLNWTVIRPPWLRDSKHTGNYRISINEPLDNPSKLSRADLADYIIKHLTDEKTFKSMVEISY